MAAALFFLSAAVSGNAADRELTDILITDAIEDELLMDHAVPLHSIDVIVNGGIVTLSGTVENILAKDRASRIAKTVKGVRSVVNNIRVSPLVPSPDREIRNDVKDALLQDPATESHEVNVDVKNSTVMLSGNVNSFQEKELCEKVAKGVKGVKAVRNNIAVTYKTDRIDREIKAKVEQALRWDSLVDHVLVDVAVEDGKVFLTGTVGSAAEKDEAFLDAYVAGVKSVDTSGLKVEKWARDKALREGKYTQKPDDQVREAVESALLYDPRVPSFDVTTQVSSGVVTLRGVVDNPVAKRAAAQDARNTVGVAYVKNRLKVRPVVHLTDEKIENRVQRALSRDPYVDRYDITVVVTGGIVDLFGVVDSHFEKAQAEEVTSRVNGVQMVDNNLSVQKYHEFFRYDPYVDDWYPYDYHWYRNFPRYPMKSDAQIKEDIEDQLYWSPFVDAGDVNVSVSGGTATLTGVVDSWSEYRSAQENAYEGGAVYVDNDLVVKKGG
jgi:osmotically-inducible protein OsmY